MYQFLSYFDNTMNDLGTYVSSETAKKHFQFFYMERVIGGAFLPHRPVKNAQTQEQNTVQNKQKKTGTMTTIVDS